MVIETNRLLLRPFNFGDAADCFAFLSDRETCMAEKLGGTRVGDYPPALGEPMALYEFHA